MKRLKDKKNSESNPSSGKLIEGIVSFISNRHIDVYAENSIVSCMFTNSFVKDRNTLSVGDNVLFESIGHEQYKLVKVLPRSVEIFRGNRRANKEPILLAANIDVLITVVTAEYLQHQAGYVEYASILAQRHAVEHIVYVSKMDLVSESIRSIVLAKTSLFRDVAFLIVSSDESDVESRIKAVTNGKRTVLIGDRGCGKTRLLNRLLQASDNCNVIERIVSTDSKRLYMVNQYSYYIDTPGFRDLALSDVSEQERMAVFPEIAEISLKCQFSNCSHSHEEGCAVTQSLRNMEIRRERFDTFKEMSGSVVLQPKADYRRVECLESFICKVCGQTIQPDGAGSRHRNHCPKCLSSIHVDKNPGDRASLCKGVMDPISVWVRKDGEWAIIHKCRVCGDFCSNRIAADDNTMLLMSIAVKPLSMPPFPLNRLADTLAHAG